MKTIREIITGELRRVNNAEAQKAVATGDYSYAPKSAWKNREPIARGGSKKKIRMVGKV